MAFGGRPRLSNDTSDDVREAHRVGQAVEHEPRQSVPCVQGDVPPLFDGADGIQAARLQPFRKPVSMRLRGNDHGGSASFQSSADKSTRCQEQRRVLCIELNDVRAAIVPRTWRG